MLLTKTFLGIIFVILITSNLYKTIKKKKVKNKQLLYLKVAEMFILFSGIIISIPFVKYDFEIEKIATYINNLKNIEKIKIYSYQTYPQSIPPLIKSEIGIVDWKGELAFGISKLSKQLKKNRFPDNLESFSKLWKSDYKVLLILKTKKLNQLQSKLNGKFYTKWKGKKYVLVSNFK